MDKCEIECKGDLYYINLLLSNSEIDSINYIKSQFDAFKFKFESNDFLGKLFFAFDLSDENITVEDDKALILKVVSFESMKWRRR